MEVVPPVPWFPFTRLPRGAARPLIPRLETQDGLTVHHPRYLSVPGVLKSLDGLLYVGGMLPYLSRIMRRTPFDLIDAHFAYPDGLAGLLLARRLGVPFTVTLRGTEVPLSQLRLRRPQIKRVLRSADRVIGVSQSLADLAQRLGAPAARVRVVPNGTAGPPCPGGPERPARPGPGLLED